MGSGELRVLLGGSGRSWRRLCSQRPGRRQARAVRAQGEALGLEEPQAAVGQSQRAQGHGKHWQRLLRLGGEHTGLHRAVQG